MPDEKAQKAVNYAPCPRPSQLKELAHLSHHSIHNVNVKNQRILISPTELKSSVAVSEELYDYVAQSRLEIQQILNRDDPRIVVVVGPCSIHDPDAALDYASRLKSLSDAVSDTLLLVMRVYFEKPRTTVGWKGLINDPFLDDSFQIETGLQKGRQLLRDVLKMGLPTATEALDPITPQYLQDLICWSAIGARTTESQTHREMASGLSSPVGIKNGTDGKLGVAINALQSVSKAHRFLGINSAGKVSVFETRGNAHGHIVLRGGSSGPNYESAHIAACERALLQAGLSANIMVDCSHANSDKDPALQPAVARDVAAQIAAGNRSIIGLMLESNLEAGRQDLPADPALLRYGVSVTDGCIGWATTEQLILELAQTLKAGLQNRRPTPE